MLQRSSILATSKLINVGGGRIDDWKSFAPLDPYPKLESDNGGFRVKKTMPTTFLIKLVKDDVVWSRLRSHVELAERPIAHKKTPERSVNGGCRRVTIIVLYRTISTHFRPGWSRRIQSAFENATIFFTNRAPSDGFYRVINVGKLFGSGWRAF